MNAPLVRPRAPEPPGLPVLGHAWPLLRRPGDFLLETTRELGPSFLLRYGTTRALLVSSPTAVREVLVEQAAQFTKGYEEMRVVLGDGLITAEDAHWVRHRRLMTPMFRPDAVASYVPAFAEAAGDLVAAWEAQRARGGRVDAHVDFTELTFRIAGLTLFGVDLAGDSRTICRAATTMMRIMFEISTSPLSPPLWVPTRRHLALRRALRTLDGVVARVIAERRAQPAARPNVLSRLLEARDEQGQPLDDRELRDETVTLLLAGHETTANVMTWAMVLLARHPEWTAALRQRIVAAHPGDTPIRPDAVPELRWAILEAMRLYPPGWLFERRAMADTVIDGYDVARGTRVAVCPWAMHRSPRLWTRPDAFEPERFAPEAAAGRDRHAFIPFSAGPRQCIGMTWGMAEMQVILGQIVRRFTFTLAPDARIEPDFAITLRPKYGVPLVLAGAD